MDSEKRKSSTARAQNNQEVCQAHKRSAAVCEIIECVDGPFCNDCYVNHMLDKHGVDISCSMKAVIENRKRDTREDGKCYLYKLKERPAEGKTKIKKKIKKIKRKFSSNRVLCDRQHGELEKVICDIKNKRPTRHIMHSCRCKTGKINENCEASETLESKINNSEEKRLSLHDASKYLYGILDGVASLYSSGHYIAYFNTCDVIISSGFAKVDVTKKLTKFEKDDELIANKHDIGRIFVNMLFGVNFIKKKNRTAEEILKKVNSALEKDFIYENEEIKPAICALFSEKGCDIVKLLSSSIFRFRKNAESRDKAAARAKEKKKMRADAKARKKRSLWK